MLWKNMPIDEEEVLEINRKAKVVQERDRIQKIKDDLDSLEDLKSEIETFK